MPKVPSRALRVIDATVMLIVVLLAAGLLAGAFDPRVLDSEDLTTLGLVLPRESSRRCQVAPPEPRGRTEGGDDQRRATRRLRVYSL